RVADALDGVVAVAVEALCGIGVAQRVDLAVIGLHVALVVVDVAAAAVARDDEADVVGPRAADLVRGVAIGAHGGVGVLVLQHFGAVHRSGIGLALLDVAVAADARDRQAPLPGRSELVRDFGDVGVAVDAL